jgi:hypothetical protein
MRKLGVVRLITIPITTPGQILGPSLQRVALFFSPPTSGVSYTIGTDAGISTGIGLNLLSTTPGVLITRELYGDLVNRAWFGVTGGASPFSIGVIETITEE